MCVRLLSVLSFLVCVIASRTTLADEIKIGDIVVISKDGVSLRSGDRVIADLPKGSSVKVLEIRGDWLLTEYVEDEKTRKGFIKVAEVIQLITKPDSSAVAPDENKNGAGDGVVKAKEFVIVDDDGRERITLTVMKGSPVALFRDDAGKTRVLVGILSDGPKVQLYDRNENRRADVGLVDDEPFVSLFDKEKTPRLILAHNSKQGASHIWLYDSTGVTRAGLALTGDTPAFAIRENGANTRISGIIGEDGPKLEIMKDGETVFSVPEAGAPGAQETRTDRSSAKPSMKQMLSSLSLFNGGQRTITATSNGELTVAKIIEGGNLLGQTPLRKGDYTGGLAASIRTLKQHDPMLAFVTVIDSRPPALASIVEVLGDAPRKEQKEYFGKGFSGVGEIVKEDFKRENHKAITWHVYGWLHIGVVDDRAVAFRVDGQEFPLNEPDQDSDNGSE